MAGPRAPACRQRSGHEVDRTRARFVGQIVGWQSMHLAMASDINALACEYGGHHLRHSPDSTRSPWRNGRRSSSIRGQRSMVSAGQQGDFGGRPPGPLASHTRTTSRGMPSPNFRNRIRGGIGKILRRAHVWVIAYHKEKGPDCPLAPGARHASCSKASTRCRAHFGGPVLQPPDCVRSGPTALFGGFSGTATRRPTGRVRWVMWRRCRTCPVRDSGDTSRSSRHRPHLPPLPDAAQTPP